MFEEEAIVNNTLVLFLEVLSHILTNGKSEWTPSHISFRSTFETAKFEARTDRCLQSLNGQKAQAIVEVQPRLRMDNETAIQMQEAGQIAGWISNDTNLLPILNGGKCSHPT